MKRRAHEEHYSYRMIPGTLVSHPEYGEGLVTEFREDPRAPARADLNVVCVLWNKPRTSSSGTVLTEFSCYVTELDIVSEVEE